jgi:hypothetical protein
MKSAKDDAGAAWAKWYRTRRAHLLCLSGEPPKHLFADELTLTICCRYAQWLLRSQRILRFLNKYHLSELRRLQTLLVEFEKTCGVASALNQPPRPL